MGPGTCAWCGRFVLSGAAMKACSSWAKSIVPFARLIAGDPLDGTALLQGHLGLDRYMSSPSTS